VGAIGTKVGDGLEQDRSRIGAGRAGPESQDQNRSRTSNWELDRSWSNSNKSWRRAGAEPEQDDCSSGEVRVILQNAGSPKVILHITVSFSKLPPQMSSQLSLYFLRSGWHIGKLVINKPSPCSICSGNGQNVRLSLAWSVAHGVTGRRDDVANHDSPWCRVQGAGRVKFSITRTCSRFANHWHVNLKVET
jgi:hypothetical protein